jgi:hypothetical protein
MMMMNGVRFERWIDILFLYCFQTWYIIYILIIVVWDSKKPFKKRD